MRGHVRAHRLGDALKPDAPHAHKYVSLATVVAAATKQVLYANRKLSLVRMAAVLHTGACGRVLHEYAAYVFLAGIMRGLSHMVRLPRTLFCPGASARGSLRRCRPRRLPAATAS